MKNVLVTGAGSGFGKLFSVELAKRGYNVFAGVEITCQITDLLEIAKQNNININVFKLDITKEKEIDKAAELDIDILVNNAGIGEGGAIVDIPEYIMRNQFEVNYFGTFNITQRFLRKFVEKKSGRVVFISSVAGLISVEKNGAYCASKHAIESLAETIQIEMQDKFNITVSTINPGPYQTGFNDRLIEGSNKWYNKMNAIINHDNPKFPMDQYPPTQDISKMVDIIIDEKAKFRNVVPQEIVDLVKEYQENRWK